MNDAADGQPSGADRQGIQSIEIAMRILRALELARAPLGLSQIAAASGMSTSKAHRYLVSLGRVGMITQSQRAGVYDFGPAIRQLGIEAVRRMDEVGVATEFLPALRDQTSHAVSLAVWGDNGPIVVYWEHGAHALPMSIRIGSTLPLLETSVGRIFLTYLPDAMTFPVLAADSALGQVSEEVVAQVATIREEVRVRGTAYTYNSVMAGLAAVSAPVFSAGALPLTISVALPVRLADDEMIDSVERAVLRTAVAITAALGEAPRP